MADAIRINGARIGLPDFDLRYKVSQILASLVKFAADSAVDGSRMLIPGKKYASKTVQRVIDIPLSTPSKAKKIPDVKVANHIPFQVKMQEVEEHVNNLKQGYETSPNRVDGSQPPKISSDDDLRKIDIMKKNGRRVFIRSRL
ncbi:uncharacterized protein LOC129313674 [Prosopis cineraria]|uniref:uncharacterized protein LOC129313674 n=1 Tax=Prosopis cineraria TaxID=364024 RepID=UPI00240F2BC7|nr:uncharacterized protein LOC129313674 [Prosopis cineraria]